MIIEFIQKIRRILKLALITTVIALIVLSAALVLVLTILFKTLTHHDQTRINIYEVPSAQNQQYEKNTNR